MMAKRLLKEHKELNEERRALMRRMADGEYSAQLHADYHDVLVRLSASGDGLANTVEVLLDSNERLEEENSRLIKENEGLRLKLRGWE